MADGLQASTQYSNRFYTPQKIKTGMVIAEGVMHWILRYEGGGEEASIL